MGFDTEMSMSVCGDVTTVAEPGLHLRLSVSKEMWRKNLPALTLLLVSAVVPAQQSSEAVEPTLTLPRRLAVVDVVVTDQNDQPVPGLHGLRGRPQPRRRFSGMCNSAQTRGFRQLRLVDVSRRSVVAERVVRWLAGCPNAPAPCFSSGESVEARGRASRDCELAQGKAPLYS